MKIELKERTKVMNILESGNLGDKPKASIGLLARYYIEQGKEKNEIITILDEFLNANLKEYNTVVWSDDLEKVVKNAIKFNKPIVELESVTLTKDEIKAIKDIPNMVKQKVLFSYIVYYKVLEKMNKATDGWISETYRADVFKESNTGYKGFKQLDLIRELVELGYMENAKGGLNNSFRLLYIKEETPENPVEMTIDDFRELGLQWMKYNGDTKLKHCNLVDKKTGEVYGCEILFKPKSNRQCLCKECAKKKELEDTAKRVSKYRKNEM